MAVAAVVVFHAKEPDIEKHSSVYRFVQTIAAVSQDQSTYSATVIAKSTAIVWIKQNLNLNFIN